MKRLALGAAALAAAITLPVAADGLRRIKPGQPIPELRCQRSTVTRSAGPGSKARP
jgi:hypothetical protein